MMNYKNIRVPFLGNRTIKNGADLFRKKFWDTGIPVDIEYIIDIKLKLYIIPFPEMHRFFGMDAFITSDWSSVYVDKDAYYHDNRNRLRFSLAHEMGHFVLHKDIYRNFGIKNFQDFYEFFEQISQEQYRYLESQANKFANYLLVPREILMAKKNNILKEVRNKVDLSSIDKKTLDSHLSVKISKIFGVSDQVAEIALNDINNEKTYQ